MSPNVKNYSPSIPTADKEPVGFFFIVYNSGVVDKDIIHFIFIHDLIKRGQRAPNKDVFTQKFKLQQLTVRNSTKVALDMTSTL